MAILACDFTGADGDLTTPGRTTVGFFADTGGANIVSNQVTTTGAVSSRMRATTALATADHRVVMTISVLSASSDRSLGVRLRCSDTADTAYEVELNQLNNRYVVSKTIAGAGSGVSGFVSLPATLTLPCTFGAEIEGSSIRVLLNGAVIGTHTDTSITGGLFPGLRGYNGAGAVRGDDWVASDLAAPGGTHRGFLSVLAGV